VHVIVNGQPRQVRDGTTVAELLADLELPRRGIAVEVNEAIVPRIRHAEKTLHDGDRLEVVSLVGGG
jgi:thiamine biosynthesis protein ThiS